MTEIRQDGAGVEITGEDLREVLRIFGDSTMRQLTLEIGGVHLHVSKDGGAPEKPPAPPGSAGNSSAEGNGTPVATTAEAAAPQPPVEPAGEPAQAAAGGSGRAPSSAADTGSLIAVRAPTIGTFYRRPSPDRPPFVEVGDLVAADTVVGTLEVMKMYTEIVAGAAGRVARIEAANGQMVEHDTVVMYLEPVVEAP